MLELRCLYANLIIMYKILMVFYALTLKTVYPYLQCILLEKIFLNCIDIVQN